MIWETSSPSLNKRTSGIYASQSQKKSSTSKTYYLCNHSKHDYITGESIDIVGLNFREGKISGKIF
jgi:hypothetical protein